MTDKYAIARIIRRMVTVPRPTAATEAAIEHAARIVESYDPQRPCFYERECMLYGRCPHDPVCNN